MANWVQRTVPMQSPPRWQLVEAVAGGERPTLYRR